MIPDEILCEILIEGYNYSVMPIQVHGKEHEQDPYEVSFGDFTDVQLVSQHFPLFHFAVGESTSRVASAEETALGPAFRNSKT